MNNKKIIIIAKPKVGSLQLHVATDKAQFFALNKNTRSFSLIN